MSDFISYSRRDASFVRHLAERLAQDNRNVWVDWEDIPATADWWNAIRAGIEAADSFIFVISPDSVRSEICQNEISHAVANNKRFIPILYRDLIEENDIKALHPVISSHNWLFFRDNDDVEDAVDKLIKALDTDLAHVNEHTRLLVRALEWDQKGRDRSLLLNGTEIGRAENWLTEGVAKKPEPTDLHTQYILASRTAAIRRQNSLLIGVTIALVVAVGLAIMSLLLFQRAEEQHVLADANRALAVEAQEIAEKRGDESNSLALAANARNVLAENNPSLALTLALNAYEANQPPLADVQQTVAQAIYAPSARDRFTNHTKSVIDVAFAPDGNHGMSVSNDGTMIEWDLTTHQAKRSFNFGGVIPTAVAYSPRGGTATVGLFNGFVLLWDVEEGVEISRFLNHTDMITSLAFTPDGQNVLSGSLDRTLRLWNVESNEEILLMESPGAILDLTVSLDGTLAVSSSGDYTLSGNDPVEQQDRTVRVWDLATGEELQRFNPKSGFVRAVAISSDNHYVASGSWSQDAGSKLQLWNLNRGDLDTTFTGHTDVITSILFDADVQNIYSGSWDSTIRVWDIENKRESQRFQGLNDRVLSMSLSPNNEFILAGTGNVGSNAFDPKVDSSIAPSVWMWDLKNRSQLHTLSGHQDWIWSVALSHDGTIAASGSGSLNPPLTDASVRLWDVETGAELHKLEGHTGTVKWVAFSPDDSLLASASSDGTVRLWDTETGQSRVGYSGHTDQILSVDFSPDGQTAVSSSTDKSIHLWNVVTGEEIRRFEGHSGAVNSVFFSADGRYILSASHDRTIRLWDVETGTEIRQFIGHSEPINQAIFSPDDKLILSTSWDTSARLWDVETGSLIYQFIGHVRPVFAAAFSPDGKTALTGAADSTLRLWDITTGQEVRRLTGHTSWVLSAMFSPDGRFALSGAEDNTARLWRLEQSLGELINWGYNNRYIPVLTCAERVQYNVQPFCNAEGTVPGSTPLPNITPTVPGP